MPSAPYLESSKAEKAGVIEGHHVEEADAAGVARGALLVFDLAVLSTVTPIVIPFLGRCVVRHAIPHLWVILVGTLSFNLPCCRGRGNSVVLPWPLFGTGNPSLDL